MDVDLYAWRFKQGDKLERRGSNLEAAQFFETAAGSLDTTRDQQVDAKNRAGVNYRLAGEMQKALQTFDWILSNKFIGRERHARALRDMGMVYFDQGNISVARMVFNEAAAIQEQAGLMAEYGATVGFIGRTHFAEGNLQEALVKYWEADVILTDMFGNKVYAMNNRIWLLKAVPFKERVLLGPRTTRLALSLHFWRRAAEAIVLTIIGNRLYTRTLDRRKK